MGLSLMEKAMEHEKMSEMLNLFKNKLISENCFHVKYGAKKLGPYSEEIIISYMRDRTFEEEFFLIIESKEFNPKTGYKDKELIAIEDIDEIEHTEGL